MTVPAAEPGLVGYWSLDEGAGSTAADYSGNENTGSLVNGSIWISANSVCGVSFNAVDDYVAMPHSDSVNLSKELTVSA